MILADTSAWVEYDRATGSRVDRRMTNLISGSGPLYVSEPIVMEVVAGARNEARATDLRRLLLHCGLLHFDSASDFDAASRLYRQCRRSGITPRGMIDCMIAAVAWRRGAVLLAQDADLHRVARILGVEMDEASFGD